MTAEREAARAGADTSGARDDPAQHEAGATRGSSTAEWIAAAAGLTLLLGALGFLIHDALQDGGPPDIAVVAESIQPVTSGFLVQIRAINHGGATAGRVLIEGTLLESSARIESSQATIGYLPLRSERRAGLFFTRDPRRFDLRLRATGYEVP